MPEQKKLRIGKYKAFYAIVDPELYDFLNQFNWGRTGNYIRGYIHKISTPLHHMIVGVPLNGMVVDRELLPEK